MEDYTFTAKLRGEPPGELWGSANGDDDWEFAFASRDTPEHVYRLWDGAVERSRTRLEGAGGIVRRHAQPCIGTVAA